MKNKMKYLALIFSVLLLVSCKEKSSYSKIDNTQKIAKSDTHKIVINETIDGGTYLYLNVDENGEEYWMAIPATKLIIGKTYYYDGGMLMKDFESKQLGRTFDFIKFAEGVRESEEAVAMKKTPHATPPAPKATIALIEQPKGGVSLNELFSSKESYSNKEILVKGRVTKVNNGIMDKNWVHIADGTEFENKKSLTVTTLETLKVGDIVTFKGSITLNKDFGAGYIYDILLEKGILIK